MTARLTVVFDDEELYRRTKIRAAEEGVPVKRIVEEALTAYVDGAPGRTATGTTGADVLAFMDKMKELDDDPNGPTLDYSDIKHHLYGYPKRRLRPENYSEFVDRVERDVAAQRYVAEERAPYDAGRPNQ